MAGHRLWGTKSLQLQSAQARVKPKFGRYADVWATESGRRVMLIAQQATYTAVPLASETEGQIAKASHDKHLPTIEEISGRTRTVFAPSYCETCT